MDQTYMQSGGDDWVNEQTAELLALVPSYADQMSAAPDVLERAAEALEAEIGAIVQGDEILASVGFPGGDVPVGLIMRSIQEEPSTIDIPGLGRCRVTISRVCEENSTFLLLARSGEEPFTHFEGGFIRSVVRVLVLAFQMIAMVEHERTLRDSLEERQLLLEKLSRIQGSISHRAPLQEVLDSITAGARELLDVEIAGLRLLDPDDPEWAILVSCEGIPPTQLDLIRRSRLSAGAGGRAIAEGRLYVVNEYESSPDAIPYFADDHLHAAMAAPVYEEGEVVGSLVVATYDPSRTYTESEREMVIALAQHASIALTDAKTLESMREAQRAKDMFLAMVSHELKTPLTVIMGTVQTFRRHLDRLPEDLREEMLRTAWDRGRDLERLINMLLKGARAELAGVKQLSPLPKIVARALRGFEQARHLVVAEIPELILFVDDVAVHQILGNLVENAVTHSPPDSRVQITTYLHEDEVEIAVRNEGSLPPNIDPAKLFVAFERGEGARSSGVGLGLHIAAQLAHSIGGRIEVESAGGVVRFSLLFPLERAQPEEVPETAFNRP